MNVIAAPGIKVPKESQPHSYIDDAAVVDVPDTAYYQRRLIDGDLLPAPDDVAAAPALTTAPAALKAVPKTNPATKE